MSLLHKITEDMKIAMKAREQFKVNTLRMLISQIKNSQIDSGKELNEEQELTVLMSAAKKRKEAIDIYSTSNRKDLLDQETKELSIINEYLPVQMSDEDVEKIILEIISETGAASMKDMGKVMGLAMQQLKGKADGKKVQDIVKNKLM